MKLAFFLKLILVTIVMWNASACSANQSNVATSTSEPAASRSAPQLMVETSTSASDAGQSTSQPIVEPTNTPVPSGGPYDEAAIPQKDIETALINAQQNEKLVLLDFGANWCPDCVVLSMLFEDPSVQPYLQENFYVVKIDVGEWDKNLDIAQQYGNPIEKGIPAVVVLSTNGDIIATTKDGALANARTASPQEILDYLKRWVAEKP